MYINIFFHNFSSSDKMNTRNKIILSGIIAVFLAMSLTTVMAITQPVDTDKDGKDLSVTFLKDCWSFCQDERIVGKGSVPDGESIETAGCAATDSYRRSYSYAFTGEQVQVLVVARDPNGINPNHPLTGVLKVGGQEIGWCHVLDATPSTSWSSCGHDLDLTRFPEAFGTILAGYNSDYDRLLECTLTVQDSDLMSGELGITVEVSNAAGQSGESSPDTWNFNPEVELNIAPSAGTVIMFPQGYAGETVYSTDPSGGRQYLVIKNEGEVDIAVWLGGTDLTSSDGALECPLKNNVLEVEDAMSFQCKVETVKYYDQEWHPVMNKDLTDNWGCTRKTTETTDVVDGSVPTCYSLCPIFVSGSHTWCVESTNTGLAGGTSGPVISGAPMYNIVVAGHPVDCEFRLVYPMPCYMTGSIDTGSLLLLLRAV
jgi:hypothetical protein